MNQGVDFRVAVKVGKAEGVLDTREVREILGDVPLDAPEIRAFLRDYIQENLVSIYGGRL